MDYTIFSDSMAAIERVLTDRAGPIQALTRAVIELERLLTERGAPTLSAEPRPRGVWRATRWPTTIKN